MTLRRKRIDFPGPPATLVLLVFLFLGCPLLHAASDTPDPNTGSGMKSPAAEKQVEEAGSIPVAIKEKTSDDEYGDVTEKEAGSNPAAASETVR